MNLSYGRIYNEVTIKNLKSPDAEKTYLIDTNKDNKNLTYVSLGDSLSAGVGTNDYKQSYPYLTAEKLSSINNITLKDISYPGFKSADVKNILLPITLSTKPDIITILIGVNDIREDISNNEFKNNYEQIVQSLTKNTKAKIYIISIPFLGSSSLILPPYNYYFNFKTNEFNKIIKNLSTKYNVGYIDLYSPTITEFKKSDSYYSADLFHPSAKGYAFWANIIYDDLNK